MAYRSALVDRAFIQRKVQSKKKVGGRYIATDEPTLGSEFRVRLVLPNTMENRRDGRVATNPTPMLMTDRKSKDGALLEFRTSDKIKVVSKQLGTALWEVNGEPEALRKKRKVIGWQLPVSKVDEAPVEREP